ncbi:MAG: acyl-CoA dehydrogenase family protein [Actinomycetota bacterium]
MSEADNTTSTDTEILAELHSWLEENWNPDLTVAEWWERLGVAGWAAPSLPTHAYGRGVARSVAVQISQAITSFGAMGAPDGLGLLLAAPTIADHGTPEQIETYVRDIVTGQKAWCQLFSEPGAGSDLAGLTTRAILDGEEYVVTGQKVWTSLGQSADMGMLIARTSPDAPKHQGISYFALDMHQEGVEVRPLREMTGHAMFNETFLTEARVATSALIGGKDKGWSVANTTLSYERSGLGSGGGSRGVTAVPGTISGNLPKRVGDFITARPSSGRPRPSGTRNGVLDLMIGLAKGNGTNSDELIRQDLVRLYALGEIGRLNAERLKATRANGGDIPGMGNISKLSMSNIVRLQRELGLRIVGAQGMLHGYESHEGSVVSEATGNPFLGAITMTALYAQAPSIYGGTDQIQRNIVAERVLGLPREQGPDANVPFSSLPKNG